MQYVNLTKEEIQILQTLVTYGAVNDANIFVADDLIITDKQAQDKIEKLRQKFRKLDSKKEG